MNGFKQRPFGGQGVGKKRPEIVHRECAMYAMNTTDRIDVMEGRLILLIGSTSSTKLSNHCLSLSFL